MGDYFFCWLFTTNEVMSSWKDQIYIIFCKTYYIHLRIVIAWKTAEAATVTIGALCAVEQS